MKSASTLIICGLTLLTLAASADAQSPREQLQQMVEQLQRSPGDNALRERIIKLGAEIKPAPALPEEAVRYTGRTMFVFKTAKSEADYLDAAREYERGLRARRGWRAITPISALFMRKPASTPRPSALAISLCSESRMHHK